MQFIFSNLFLPVLHNYENLHWFLFSPVVSLFELWYIYLISMCIDIGIDIYNFYHALYSSFLNFFCLVGQFLNGPFWILPITYTQSMILFYFSFPRSLFLPFFYLHSIYLAEHMMSHCILWPMPLPFSLSSMIKYINCSLSIILINFPSHLLFGWSSSSS